MGPRKLNGAHLSFDWRPNLVAAQSEVKAIADLRPGDEKCRFWKTWIKFEQMYLQQNLLHPSQEQHPILNLLGETQLNPWIFRKIKKLVWNKKLLLEAYSEAPCQGNSPWQGPTPPSWLRPWMLATTTCRPGAPQTQHQHCFLINCSRR